MGNVYIDSINAFYIICMSIGILLSLFALILGSGHGTSHAPHAIHGSAHADMHIHHGQVSEESASSNRVPLLNINALFAFLIGFGAAGLIAYGKMKAAMFSLIPAIIVGGICWYIVRKLLAVMLKGQSNFLTTSLEDIIGVTGTVSSGLSEQRIGEVIYTFEGNNRAIPAKHKYSGEIAKGEEVVIIDIVNGVAVVVQGDNLK